jgi:hypothetical protein
MSLAVALKWLREPLMDIKGVIDIVSSFFFRFQGVQVRELTRRSKSVINCLVPLSNAWAVGDMAGDVTLYDS